MAQFVITYLKYKCKAKLKRSPSKTIEEGIELGGGDFIGTIGGMLFPRHFDNSLSETPKIV